MPLPSLKTGLPAMARGFAPLLIFYGFDWTLGLRAAIVASALWSMGEVGWRLARREKIDVLFKFTAVTTFVFGGLDLLITQPRFFSYEAVVTNLVTGAFFAAAGAATVGPMMEQVAAINPEAAKDPELPLRLRVVIAACALLCFVKAAVYAVVAMRFSVEQAMAIRSAVGTGSMIAFVVGLRLGLDPLMKLVRRLGFGPVPSNPEGG
jgi:intracellular septation protein A